MECVSGSELWVSVRIDFLFGGLSAPLGVYPVTLARSSREIDVCVAKPLLP